MKKNKTILAYILLGLSFLLFLIGLVLIIYSLIRYFNSHIFAGLNLIGVVGGSNIFCPSEFNISFNCYSFI